MLIETLCEQFARIRQLDEQLAEIERRLQVWHREDEACRRIAAIPDVGLLTATAAVATMGDPKAFRSGMLMLIKVPTDWMWVRLTAAGLLGVAIGVYAMVQTKCIPMRRRDAQPTLGYRAWIRECHARAEVHQGAIA